MTTLTVASKANQAITLPAVLAAEYTGLHPNTKVNFDYVDSDKLSSSAIISLKTADHTVEGAEQIIAHFADHESLDTKSKSLVKEWVDRLPKFGFLDYKALEPQLLELDAHLILRSHIVGYALSLADVTIWGAIRGNRLGVAAVKKGSMVNLARWFHFLEESNPWLQAANQALNASANEKKQAASKKGASYDIALQNTEKGVVTRFPPEPSGYLHIGHAKAALLNDYFAHEAYPGGKLICRFDDTNPSKEKEEFQDAIMEDLALMGIKPDQVTYSSNYFQEMYEACVKMIKEGKAYADDTEQEQMRHERTEGIASKRRDATAEENLARFEEMKKGTEEGLRWCIRAKISVDDNNKAMRDPVIYRCNLTPHHRTGATWKIYPTYDLCVAILDALEGVTHALRTIEYRDRNPQYHWMQKALGVREVQIWDFARMNFIRTLLSKRKLTKFVDTGVVWGWDDPRMPTVRGFRRRGCTIPALRETILLGGPSRNITYQDYNTLWTLNKRVIDPVSPRFTAVEKKDSVPISITGGPEKAYTENKPKHAKNPDVGTKEVVYSSKIIIDQEDGKTFKQDEEITLMGWGNAIVRKIEEDSGVVKHITMELHLEGDFRKTEKKITWLSTEGQQLVNVRLYDFDYILSKDRLTPEEEDHFEDFVNPQSVYESEAVADKNLAQIQKDDIIQLERKGYYRCDGRDSKGIIQLFAIPTGKGGK